MPRGSTVALPLAAVPAAFAALVLLPAGARAQAVPAPPAPAASAPAAAPAQRVEINAAGGRDDSAERQRSTASRITIGRDEIDRMGDQSLGDVLRRLPGVTLGGPPGRPGAGGVRMRGMGGGYTQILIDGQRMAPGFSLESIAPEQIERIEIMRAPVAEHGARAIAGTINVVLRSDFRRKAHEFRFGGGTDGGEPQAGATLQRNGQDDRLGWNLSATSFVNRQPGETETRTRFEQADGTPTLDRRQQQRTLGRSVGLFLSSRLSWKLDGGGSLELQPFLHTVRNRPLGEGRYQQSLPPLAGATPAELPPYLEADWQGRSQWQMGRLLGVWNTTLGDGGRLTMRFGGTLSRSENHTDRDETGGRAAFDADGQPITLTTKRIDNDARDLSLDWNGKFSQLIGERHSASAGWELQHNRRRDRSATLRNGQPDETDLDFGSSFEARVQRLALYAQDEWAWDRRLSFYVGARWETIDTRAVGSTDATPANRSSVLTPLAHLVWKLPDGPDGKPSRDQLRASLTRSYRSPNTNQLIGRRQISAVQPPSLGGNSPTYPDRLGNPALKPELAWGLELGFEHYPAGGGILSANAYGRLIDQVIRQVTTLREVDYADVPRWVAQPVNLGRARAAGLELEARGRLDELGLGDLPLTLRANLSLMWSRVDGVPGPDNRLEGQPPWTANLGLDGPLKGTPLQWGTSLNWTPAFAVRHTADQRTLESGKPVLDAYALWRLDTNASLRLSLSNLLARPHTVTVERLRADGGLESSSTRTRSWRNLNLRAELRF